MITHGYVNSSPCPPPSVLVNKTSTESPVTVNTTHVINNNDLSQYIYTVHVPAAAEIKIIETFVHFIPPNSKSPTTS